MRRREVLCFLWVAFLLGVSDLVAGDADSVIPPGTDPAHFQGRLPLDARPRLSASQQAQILSDVQQHQNRYRRPQQEQQRIAQFSNFEQQKIQGSTAFPSLAKYKVDRAKQQQIQQLLQQQQQVQQLIDQQQQKIAQQLGPNFLNNAQLQFQTNSPKLQQFQQQQQQQQHQQQYNQFQTPPSNYRNLQQDLSQPLFSDQQTVQLQEYFEKQRELELLQKQRQQLLLEQQELRRQQELLRIQQLKQLTSTTPPPPPPPPPTTPPTTTQTAPSTTTSPLLVSLPAARKITPSEAELFLKAIASHQKKFSTTTSRPTTAKPVTKSTTHERVTATSIPENILTLLQEQHGELLQKGKPKPEIKVIYQTEKPTTQKSSTTKGRSSSASLSERDILLKQLKIALAQSVDDDIRNVSARDIVLPDGKKVQVINAPGDLSGIVGTDVSTAAQSSTSVVTVPTTTIRPPKAIFDELTKGVLPPGADFEIIRQKSDGKLEEIGKAPIQNLPAKKVTFVVLEEQPDGSYKVQGVKGNTDKEAPDVESIVDKIKKGELKLPPSSLNPTTLTPSSTLRDISSSSVDPTVTSTRFPSSTTSLSTIQTTFKTTTPQSTSSSRFPENGRTSSEYFPFVTISPNSVPTTDKYVTSASSVTGHVFNSLGTVSTTARPTTSNQETKITTRYPAVTRNHFIPTMAPVSEIVTSTPTPRPTTFSHHSTGSYSVFSTKQSELPTVTSISSSTAKSVNNIQNDNVAYEDNFERTTPIPTPTVSSTSARSEESLTSLLRREGLYAMAKYLTLSGLDVVLNETGPYTIFVPTDKAFRTLMVQLGGPEKAELKFRDSPRLLGGLLLHHVIPGAFRIDSLQDEMTGVSLAGTQLRVNEYAMHDHEWNDVKVTTINGARVAPNKRDIEIPQGIVHAIDRVMFPLPVGDLIQTLQADRESRFTTFLRMLHVSGLEETLSAGPKTFTVFAPTDSAFEAATSKDGGPIWSEGDGAEAAKVIVSKHIIPSTLYTAGMRYYLQKDTLRQIPIHIHKNGGRVKINEAHMITQNVPATNGVLHAIDGVL